MWSHSCAPGTASHTRIITSHTRMNIKKYTCDVVRLVFKCQQIIRFLLTLASLSFPYSLTDTSTSDLFSHVPNYFSVSVVPLTESRFSFYPHSYCRPFAYTGGPPTRLFLLTPSSQCDKLFLVSDKIKRL